MPTFKERIKQLRLEKDLTMKELGEILGYSESTISLYESGKREPKNAEDYIKIADYFNVSLDYLLGRLNKKEFLNISEEVEKYKTNGHQGQGGAAKQAISGPPPELPALDLEAFIKKEHIMFNGISLDEEDKQDILDFLKIAWATMQKRKKRAKDCCF